MTDEVINDAGVGQKRDRGASEARERLGIIEGRGQKPADLC
jgi:hypothetical protein